MHNINIIRNKYPVIGANQQLRFGEIRIRLQIDEGFIEEKGKEEFGIELYADENNWKGGD